MRFKLLTTEIVAAMFSLAASALAADKDVPAWHKADPGTHAFLGDDGGGVDTATVCDTADRYRDWLDEQHPPGCQTFQHDLPVVIEIVTFDRVKDIEHFHDGDLGLPIAKVHIPSRQFVGYIRLEELHQIIPADAIVHFKKLGNGTLELYPTVGNDIDFKHGIQMGDHVTAKILKYDPSNDSDWLHVTVLDGEHAEQSGWMDSLGAEADDGHPIDQFSDAVISIPVQTEESPVQAGESSPKLKVSCASVGVAQMIVADMFNSNPDAQTLGLKAEAVRLGGVLPDGSCLVEVQTNHGYAMKYKFRYDEDGKATLDLLP